jgi:hypothetical protein
MKTDIFDFPVQRVPMYVPFGGETLKAERDAIVRTDTKDIIGYVSAAQVERKSKDGMIVVDRDYYKVVTHAEIVGEARKALRELGLRGQEVTYMQGNGGRLFHKFTFPNEGIEPFPGDFITMQMTVVNSYDLSSNIGFELGGLRQVCTNGLIAFRKAFFSLRRHSGGFELDETITKMKQAVDVFRTQMLGTYKKMANTTLSAEEGTKVITDLREASTLPVVYAEAVQSVWDNPDNANKVIPVLDASGQATGEFQHVMNDPKLDAARTVWALYNAFTLILTHYVASIDRRAVLHNAVRAKMSAMIK